MKLALHLSDGALGFSLLGAAIGSVTAIPVTGWVVSRYGSRSAVTWSSVGFSIALTLPALAVNSGTLFAALVCFGSMAGANDVAMNSLAVEVENLLGTPTMSRFHAMFSIGGIAGAALGGLVASRGVLPFAHFAGASAVLLILTGATTPLIGNAATKGAVGAADRARNPKRLPFRKLPRALFILSFIGFCILLSEGAVADWTAVYLSQSLHAGPGLAAAGYAVFSAAMAVFRLLGDAITVRLGRAPTIRLGAILAACGIAWMLSMASPYWALPGIVLAGAGYSSIIPLVFAAGGRIRGVDSGVGVATVSGLGYLGFLFGPPVIGAVSQLTTLRVGLSLLVVLAALTAALVGFAGANSEPLDGPLR